MEYYCGIDIGASAAKLVVIDPAGQVMGRNIGRSGVDYARTAEELLSGLCAAVAAARHGARAALVHNRPVLGAITVRRFACTCAARPSSCSRRC